MNDIKTNDNYFVIDDLSNKKEASQSSTAIGPYREALNAVDRNIITCMRAQPIGNSYAYLDSTVWWKVDLGGAYSIYSVNIIFKSYTEYGIYHCINNFERLIDNNEFFYQTYLLKFKSNVVKGIYIRKVMKHQY